MHLTPARKVARRAAIVFLLGLLALTAIPKHWLRAAAHKLAVGQLVSQTTGSQATGWWSDLAHTLTPPPKPERAATASLKAAPAALFATFTVNDLGDAADASLGNGVCATAGGGCTLRAAIQEANALGGTDTITFSGNGTINLTSALPDLASNIIIDNTAGPAALTVRRSSGGNYRIFNVAAGVTVTLDGLTITNGNGDEGGGIRNAGTLTIQDCTISGNNTVGARPLTGGGAGVFNAGTGSLTILRSAILNNTATGQSGDGGAGAGGGGGGLGGGIYNNGGSVTVSNVTIAGNRAIGGAGANAGGNCCVFGGGNGGGNGGAGGIWNSTGAQAGGFGGGGGGGANHQGGAAGGRFGGGGGGGIDISGQFGGGAGGFLGGNGGTGDSSQADNGAGGGGGGAGGAVFQNGGSLSLTNVTLINNSAAGGAGGTGGEFDNNGAAGGSIAGGIYNETGTLSIKNSIIAANTAASNGDCGANSTAIVTNGFNLTGTGGGCPSGGTSDQTIAASSIFTTVLGSLDYNGGLTQSYAPLTGSPVIDKGGAGTTEDQRGETRPFDTAGVASAAGGNASDIGAVESVSFSNPAVTSTNYGGPGSLARAVTVATAGSTITISTTGAITTYGGELLVDRNLTINGPGAGSLTLSGNNASRIFFVNTSTFSLSGVTIANGRAAGGNGGPGGGGAGGMGAGMFVNTGTVTLTNLAFNNNQAIGGNGGISPCCGPGGGGGGIGGNGAANSGLVGGIGGDGGGFNTVGGAGGAIGVNGANGGDGAGGGGAGSQASGGAGGFGGGGGASGFGGFSSVTYSGGVGGFGGGGGAGNSTNNGFPPGIGGAGGLFGGAGGNGGTSFNGGGGGGGGGLGGALFVRAGSVALSGSSSFTNNTATRGTGGSATSPAQTGGSGQGKGGAIFIGVNAILTGAVPAYSGNSATDAGSNANDNANLYNSSAPLFTPAAAITRQQGSPAGAAVTVGTVSDPQTAAGSLTVTQIAGGTATGITVSGITNSSGTIMAMVSASCTATTGTVRFQVSDGSSTSTGDLTVNVTAAPTPNITTQPAPQTVCAGSIATFAVTAANAVSYQWRKNGVNISGATASSYTTPTTVAGDNGALYSVVVNGTCGTQVTSGNAALTVNPATAITTQPQSATVCLGATASFSVSATGTGLSYQWRKNGVNISGATASSYTTPATVAGDNGALYSVVVTGTCGTPVTSGNATLTVNTATAITTQPQSATVCLGATASFSVAATGAGLTYQWRKNGTNISGATSSSYTTPATVAGDNGALYSVVVNGSCGAAVTSGNATLTVNTAAAITTQPQSATVCAGATASFSVAATGAGLTYQWRKNGVNISGATSSGYTTPATGAGDNGALYSVVVTGTCGTPVTSANATLTVNTATAITTQPQSTTVCAGATASFSVVAAGTGLTYQWRKNGTNISGATSSSYTTPATVAGDNGALYSVVVNGSCGAAVTSGNATLSVSAAAAITTQPQSATVCASATASFSVAATGAGLTYQWRKNGVNISGATASNYTTPATVAGDNGALYSVVVTGTCGTPVTSGNATLTVNPATAITTQPQSATVCVGASASFSVSATGTGLSYQWRKNGTNISGATASSYTTPATVAGDNGALYSVVVTGTCGTPVTSANATLTVNTATAITTQPQSATVCLGATASFSVAATGAGLTYQWRKNGTNISGATSSSYTTPATVAGDNGALYSVVVTGTCGTPVTSSNAALTVNTATAITTQPQSATVCAGATASFSVAATGAGLTYQWRKNGVNISGATGSSYITPATVAGDNGALYSVVVTGTCGTPVTSANATLTVNTATAITSQPQSATVCTGATASFSVAATGAGLTYQWRKNGVNISGATASSYTTPATVAGDNGALYSVVVSGSCGTPVTSGNGTLTVNAAAAITAQPQSATVCAGATASFSVTATGAGLTYQWRKNGINISGATSSSYTTPATVAGDNGALYSVVVTGTCGTPVTSGNATLTVNAAAAVTTQPQNATVCAGSSASFSVAATGAGLTYQWRKNGVNISGATASSYTTPATVAGDNGALYSVVVTGTCGTPVTSGNATLTVNPATVISTQPVSQNKLTGQSATFSVVASGLGTLTYQWRKGGSNISGATASSYTIASVTPGDAGNYDVVVTGGCGSVTSNLAVLNINCATITTGPPTLPGGTVGTAYNQTITATPAGSYTFAVASGAMPTGLSLNPTTGAITGTPTAAGTFTFSITATDANNCSDAQSYSVTICAPPAVTTPPAPQTVCAGSPVSFSVTATGSGLSYQWRKNTANIPGATASSYALAATTAADAASYDVVVTGTCGSATSSAAALTVNATTAINTPPANQTVCEGAPATFSVVAAGASLTYQWRKNSVNIPGATASSFNIPSTTTANAAQYDVVVEGSCGTEVISAAALLTVNTAPVINTPPVNQTVCVDAPVSFSVTATGTGLGYQWRKNNVNIPGATASSYSIAAATAADAATYTVVVSGVCGTPVTSANAVLTVNPATVITASPVNQATCLNGSVTFTVAATGTSLTYQWRKAGVEIPGATTNSLTIAAVTAEDAASYDVVVTGACGVMTSGAASLTINAGTSVNTQPQNQTVCVGAPASFSVLASGSGTLTYQWRKNDANIPGATAATFTLASVAATDAASYDVVVTSNCGTTTSNAATLTVNPVTAITAQPTNQTVCAGSPVSFSVAASGTNLTYQWRKNNANLSGATSATYNLAAASAADAGSYDVVVTGACGVVTSSAANLTVNATTAIATHPNSQTKIVGESVNFSVTAAGVNLSYQWRKDKTNIPGATASSYSIASVAQADAGSYDVVVTGTCGNATSNAATLTVNCPTITLTPATLPSGATGVPYSQTISAAGGVSPYTFSIVSGGLPGGLSLSAAGLLNGSPTASGSFTFTIRATDQNDCFGEQQYTIGADCASVTVNPVNATLPGGAAGTPYSQNLTASGGASPYSFTVSVGTLPNGLMLDSGGELSGTPTGFGSFSFTVRATDAKGCFGERAYTLRICGVISLTSSLPAGTTGTSYNQTLTASGGASPYSYAMTGGNLPPGVSLGTDGSLSGTPSNSGSFNFAVTATDAAGCTGAQNYTVVITRIFSEGGLMFYPLPQPVRLLETRAGFSGCTTPGNPMTANSTLTLPAQGVCAGIPANAAVVTGNITVVPSGSGFLTLFPSTATQPTVANSNFAAGEVTNNVFTVALGATGVDAGAFKIFSSATTHVIVDVTGYYAPPATGGLYFHPLTTPVRLLETRAGQTGCIAPGIALTGAGNANADPNLDFEVQGRSPLVSPCNSIPASAQVLVGNATSVLPSAGGYLTIYPSGGTRPAVASSNYAGTDVINGPFSVKLGADGKFKIYTFRTTHLVVDILGYYSEEATDANGPGLLFNPLPSPVRLLETRPDFPGFPLAGCTRTNAKIVGNLASPTHTQQAAGFCGLPAEAQAVVGNVSVVNSTGAGFLTLFPGNLTSAPQVATSNYPAPATFGYNRHYFVGLSPVNGTFKILTQFTTDLILDASGYFAP